MPKYYYQKHKKKNFKKIIRFLSLFISFVSFAAILYIFFPFISWQVYFAPVFASSDIAVPIPKTTVVSSQTFTSLFSNAANSISGTNYSNPQNWFPTYRTKARLDETKIPIFNLSIPKLGIKNALVSTTDNELDKHLVNYVGTAIPPDNGTAIIFGHSTLPQLFNPNNYKTIFATLYTLKVGDEFSATVTGITYTYKIHSITVVDPSDTSIFTQDMNTSHITLVTCTPPGTTWKRLIIKAKLEKI
ncbi:MAG: sortase [Candidatus Levybacteria bacterium]|nr:sortase [Candidatus Levybacteria bacterium]